jgi:hypothetical protein
MCQYLLRPGDRERSLRRSLNINSVTYLTSERTELTRNVKNACQIPYPARDRGNHHVMHDNHLLRNAPEAQKVVPSVPRVGDPFYAFLVLLGIYPTCCAIHDIPNASKIIVNESPKQEQ